MNRNQSSTAVKGQGKGSLEVKKGAPSNWRSGVYYSEISSHGQSLKSGQ